MKPEPTTQEVMDAILLAQEQIVGVQGSAMLPDDVRRAVSQGVKDAVSDPAMWSAAMKAMQTHAQTEAGGWLLGSIRAVLSKIVLFLVVGLGVYAIGGWSALAAFFKSGAHT